MDTPERESTGAFLTYMDEGTRLRSMVGSYMGVERQAQTVLRLLEECEVKLHGLVLPDQVKGLLLAADDAVAGARSMATLLANVVQELRLCHARQEREMRDSQAYANSPPDV